MRRSRGTVLARVRRLVVRRAALDAATAILDRIDVSDGDILTLTMPRSTTRADEIRMRMSLRQRLDDRRLYRTSLVTLEEGVTLRVERAPTE